MKYLTIENVLKDNIELAKTLKYKFNTGPIIAVGQSYGGELAAWLRIKYP